MFQGLFKRAESTIDSVVAKFLGRALVAIPLIVAAGFATAAVTIKLVELYGTIIACSLMAAAFALIGLVTMAIVDLSARSNGEAAVEEPPAAAASEASDEALDPMELLTPEVRALLASAAPMALPGIARGIGRNLPLIFILALIGFVISKFVDPSETSAETTTPDAEPAASEAPPAAAA